jgi:hypothetical protein
VIFYYSGHGDQGQDLDGDEDHFDFTTHEKTIRLDERLALKDGIDSTSNEMTDDELSGLTCGIEARQMVFLLVSCNSGGFLEDIQQTYEKTKPRPWASYMILVPAHENDVAFLKNKFATFFSQSIVNKALRRVDPDDWSDRESFGRVSWDPDNDVLLCNMKFIESDGSDADLPTKADVPPHWQRNHYTEEGYQPGWQSTDEGQDFPDQLYGWGEYDNCTRWVSILDYSPSNGDGIIDLEEAFYHSTHNEFMGEGTLNPEADPNMLTEMGDDPLIYDSDPYPDMKVLF